MFIDYSKEAIYNNVFAIEPEISSDFYYQHFYWESYHEESSMIYELIRVHELSQPTKNKIYNTISEYYDTVFPIWEDEYVSWWTHLHIFWNFNWTHSHKKEIAYKLLNCPLFCKIEDDTIYSRRLDKRCEFNTRWSILDNSKWEFISLKTNYYSHREEYCEIDNQSIEFRCNNVYDKRIYWYYLGILLAVKNNVRFKKTSRELRAYARTWEQWEYYPDDYAEWIALDELDGYYMWDDKLVIEYNINVIIKLLMENNLCLAGAALAEYVEEKWFIVKHKCKIKDSFTWRNITKWHIIEWLQIRWITYNRLFFWSNTSYYKFIYSKLLEWLDTELFSLNKTKIKEKFKLYWEAGNLFNKLKTLWE